MCCRFYMEMSPELKPFVDAAKRSRLYFNNIGRIAKDIVSEGEVFPDFLVPVLAPNKSGSKAVFPMIWGYNVKALSKTVINARSESAAQKVTFRDSWNAHRCIIPASWYYEWSHEPTPSGRKKTGTKYAIMPKGESVTYLCGLYRIENDYPHFVVLTREPGESIRFIHDRMPFILPKHDIDGWISPKTRPEDFLSNALTEMVYEQAHNAV